jgi:hypothetical protein
VIDVPETAPLACARRPRETIRFAIVVEGRTVLRTASSAHPRPFVARSQRKAGFLAIQAFA